MSDLTPPPASPPPPTDPLEDPTRRGARERTLRRQLLAWLALGLFCLGAIMSDWVVRNLAGSPPLEDASSVRSFQIEMVGRFSLGGRSILGPAMGSAELQAEQLADLAKSLAEIADLEDPRYRAVEYLHKFRAIIVLVEFAGAEEGLRQLGSMFEALDGIDTTSLRPELADWYEHLRTDGVLMRRVYEEGPDTLSKTQHDRLVRRHAWIGRLGVSFDRPPEDPDRASVLADARFTFLGLMGVVLGALLMLPVGLALFIVAAILTARGTIRPAYRPDLDASGPRHTSFLEVVSLFMGGLVVYSVTGALLEHLDLGDLWLALLGIGLYVGQWALLLIVLWPLLRGVDVRRLLTGLGWVRGRGLAREIGAGLVGYLAGLPLLVVGFLLMFLLIELFGLEPSHPIVERARERDLFNLLVIYSIAVLWAPIVEETVFRGAFYHHLRRWIGPLGSALVVAFVFAVVHPQGVAAMPALMALAVVFALIREWRGSLIGPIAAHAIHNGILITTNFFFLG